MIRSMEIRIVHKDLTKVLSGLSYISVAEHVQKLEVTTTTFYNCSRFLWLLWLLICHLPFTLTARASGSSAGVTFQSTTHSCCVDQFGDWASRAVKLNVSRFQSPMYRVTSVRRLRPKKILPRWPPKFQTGKKKEKKKEKRVQFLNHSYERWRLGSRKCLRLFRREPTVIIYKPKPIKWEVSKDCSNSKGEKLTCTYKAEAPQVWMWCAWRPIWDGWQATRCPQPAEQTLPS